MYAFCFPRLSRRVWAGKGVAGSRPALQASQGKVRGGRLFLVGVDTLKAQLVDRLARGGRFERIPGRRAEALDCLVYAHAARAGLQISLDAREGELATPTPPSSMSTAVASPFVQAW